MLLDEYGDPTDAQWLDWAEHNAHAADTDARLEGEDEIPNELFYDEDEEEDGNCPAWHGGDCPCMDNPEDYE